MPTPTIIDGFDHQVEDTTGFGTNTSARLWSAISNAAGITFDTTNKRTGTASLKVAEDGVTATYIRKAIPAGNRIVVGSVYFRVATAPTVSSIMMRSLGPTNYGRFRIGTNGRIDAGFLNGTAQVGPSIADGAWHRLDFRVDTSATTFTIDWQVDGVDQTQATLSAQTAADMTGMQFGSGQAADTLTVWFDDFVASYTSADYPLGAHEVRFLVPNAEGTHNNPANTLERASDGADIDGVNVVAWSMLDEWPPTSGTNNADTVTQVATNTAAYVEVQFADITDTTVWGVEAVAALQSDGTAANNGQTRIRDSNGTETTVWSGDMSDTTPRYNRAIVTVPTGGWTQAHVNALRARMGYSSDANPQPEWLALALQVAVIPAGQTFGLSLAGAVSPSATLGRLTTKATGGAAAPSGALTRQAEERLAGAQGPSGQLTRDVYRSVGGLQSPSGALARQVGKALGGALGPTGTASHVRVALVSLAGAVGAVGALGRMAARTLAGASVPAGALVKEARRAVAGALVPAGALAKMAARLHSGSVSPSGALMRLAGKAFGGSSGPSGALGRRTEKFLAGTLGPSGGLGRSVSAHLAGAVSAAGATARTTLRSVAGALAPSGALARHVGKLVAGSAQATAVLARVAGKLLAGGVTPSGTVTTPGGGAAEGPSAGALTAELTSGRGTADVDAGPATAEISGALTAELTSGRGTADVDAGPATAEIS